MLNFVEIENLSNEIVGLDHFKDIAKSSVETKELENKFYIKTNYMGLTIELFISKGLESVEDNADMEFVMQFIRKCKPGSNITIEANIGDIGFEIYDDLTIYVDHSKFNAVMTFENKKAKDLFFGLKDLVENKISTDQFQELINRYYYSIID